jgi:glycosyltransferase involved in cell wall biosynthesis
MPVYNAEKYIKYSIESILNQTFFNYEFIIIDDGSTDSSLNIIQTYNDKRIKLYKNEFNLGVIETLNIGIDISKGAFIARMDADDISLPTRFEKQILFLKKNIDVGLCGTWTKLIDEFGNISGIDKTIKNHEAIKSNLLFKNQIDHPTVMIRKELLKNNKYNINYFNCEDYELWSRLIFITKFHNIQEYLLLYRQHCSNISKSKIELREKNEKQIIINQLKNINVEISNKIELHYSIIKNDFSNIDKTILFNWFINIKNKNNEYLVYSKKELNRVLAFYWIFYCINRRFFVSIFSIFTLKSLFNVIKLYITGLKQKVRKK